MSDLSDSTEHDGDIDVESVDAVALEPALSLSSVNGSLERELSVKKNHVSAHRNLFARADFTTDAIRENSGLTGCADTSLNDAGGACEIGERVSVTREKDAAAFHSFTCNADSGDDDQLSPEETEMVKRALFRHPLFPLLAFLFEKCELATRTCGAEPNSEDLQRDLKSFMETIKCWEGGKTVIDHLMIDALRVLRIHLGELRKVDELRNNFCQRYIACLRDKMHSSKLLKDAHFDTSTSVVNDDAEDDADSEAGVDEEDDIFSSGGSGGESSQEGNMRSNNRCSGKITKEGRCVSPGLSEEARTSGTFGSISHISGSSSSALAAIVSRGKRSSSSLRNRETLSGTSGGNVARGVLPKHATELMRTWLFAHIVHPYPNEDEKRLIAEQTNLSLLQVNNWFINARRRILQPMLDQGTQKT